MNRIRILSLFLTFSVVILALFSCGDTTTCEHQWSDWEVVKEPTCGEGGYSLRTCALCSEVERNVKYPLPHTYSTSWMYDGTYHWHSATCQHTAEVSDKSAHTFDGNTCSVCNAMRATQGLAYRGNLGENTYRVIGIGTTLDTNVVVARYYNSRDIVAIDHGAFMSTPGLESVTLQVYITSIGDNAFKDCHDLKKVTFYSSVEFLGNNAFDGCTSLESVRYYGTTKQWQTLAEGVDLGNAEFEIVCNDGIIQYN